MSNDSAPVQSMPLWKITFDDWSIRYIAAETIPIALDVLKATTPNAKVQSVLSYGSVDMWYLHRQVRESVA